MVINHSGIFLFFCERKILYKKIHLMISQIMLEGIIIFVGKYYELLCHFLINYELVWKSRCFIHQIILIRYCLHFYYYLGLGYDIFLTSKKVSLHWITLIQLILVHFWRLVLVLRPTPHSQPRGIWNSKN